ncbi:MULTISPECIES: intein-containing Rv2578c family radical SAM protein [unclassified Leucobacter]|uniref:intein-containing Rv2578c family radical SAM protein n=1 Tax=unclassified Leucobacter TaxID=2621730 RepID=UPI000A72E404|nr:intein-containing Rv2578c family radical SAM protein [Leucobacter sp. Ag1]
MRWDGQLRDPGAAEAAADAGSSAPEAGSVSAKATDPALPGLERSTLAALPGHLRTVRAPEFQGAVFHEVLAKSALNRVPGQSSMPFAWTINPYRGCSHACVYCVSPETLILCADGRQRPLRELQVGAEIIGTERRGRYRRYVRTTILDKWRTRKVAYRVALADGTTLIASGDHRFLTDRGWKFVRNSESGQRPHLTTANRLMGFGLGGGASRGAVDIEGDAYRRGYLAGMVRGDGMIFRRSYDDGSRVRDIVMFRLALADEEALDRSRRYLEAEGIVVRERPFAPASSTRRAIRALHTAARKQVEAIERITHETRFADLDWCAGFLAGVFDAEGSCSRGIVRIPNKNPEFLSEISAAMERFELSHTVEPARPNGVRSIRLLGGLPTRQRFFATVQPAITRKLSVEGVAVKTVADLRVVAIEPLEGERELLDITTGTGDFIANGVISHNCFARGTHRYLDFDTGADFDQQIVVKVNVAEVLARELARPKWARETVALGTNTDPYQRAEGRYRLMPGIIEALSRSRTPISILTKGTLLRRDLPQLADAAERAPVDLAMSIAIGDHELQQSVEPGTPSTRARLETVARAREAGLPIDVFVMPVLPHLSDGAQQLDALLREIREAGARSVMYGPLHLRAGVKPWFFAWLRREHPDLVERYRGLYPEGASRAPQEYRRALAARIRPLIRKHGLEWAPGRPAIRETPEPAIPQLQPQPTLF